MYKFNVKILKNKVFFMIFIMFPDFNTIHYTNAASVTKSIIVHSI